MNMAEAPMTLPCSSVSVLPPSAGAGNSQAPGTLEPQTHGTPIYEDDLVTVLWAITCPLFPQVFAMDFPNYCREQRCRVPRNLIIVHNGKRLTFRNAGRFRKL